MVHRCTRDRVVRTCRAYVRSVFVKYFEASVLRVLTRFFGGRLTWFLQRHYAKSNSIASWYLP